MEIKYYLSLTSLSTVAFNGVDADMIICKEFKLHSSTTDDFAHVPRSTGLTVITAI